MDKPRLDSFEEVLDAFRRPQSAPPPITPEVKPKLSRSIRKKVARRSQSGTGRDRKRARAPRPSPGIDPPARPKRARDAKVVSPEASPKGPGKSPKSPERSPKGPRSLVEIARELNRALSSLSLPKDVVVYNPTEYAREPFEEYMCRFGSDRPSGRVLFVGMNPGPWGMVQTGIAFGDVVFVRDWMGIQGRVKQPSHLHPRRPVQGFAVGRRERSGQRLWSLMRSTCSNADMFFDRAFVYNYCPLAFFRGDRGKNLTPDRLPIRLRRPIMAACDEALAAIIKTTSPRFVIGVGNFAHSRVKAVCAGQGMAMLKPKPGLVLHPSPLSRKTNAGWARQAVEQLMELGAWNVLSNGGRKGGDAKERDEESQSEARR